MLELACALINVVDDSPHVLAFSVLEGEPLDHAFRLLIDAILYEPFDCVVRLLPCLECGSALTSYSIGVVYSICIGFDFFLDGVLDGGNNFDIHLNWIDSHFILQYVKC